MESYKALALAWRPRFFADLKGQGHITRALINAIARKQLHHAYLFTGTRGVGKTTIARILAKSLNCIEGILPEPCGHCAHCVAIDAGRFVDLIEVDAASRTRVEDTRELLDNVQYAPLQGRFKIYLIDEVHMLSGHSFNALLKTLEEPPSHVKFILATTDPQRIPSTILSRCLRLNLRPLPTDDIAEHLQHILTTEKIAFEPGATQLIATAGNGSMRDALSVLEQAIAYGDGCVQTQAVQAMLGMEYQSYLPSLCNAIGLLNVAEAFSIVEKMAQAGADYSQVLASLLQTLHDAAIARALGRAPEALGKIWGDLLGAEENQLLYQIGLMGQRDLPYAPDPRTGFEMVLLRMIVFRPVTAPLPVGAEKSVVSEKPVAAIASAPPPVLPEKPVAPIASALPPVVAEKPVVPTPSLPTTGTSELDWAHLITQLPLSGLARTLVKSCVVAHWDGENLSLTLEESQKACLNAQRQTQIQTALSQHFSRPIRLTIMTGETAQATPYAQAKIQSQARNDAIKQSLDNDPLLQGLLSTFDATIEKVTLEDEE